MLVENDERRRELISGIFGKGVEAKDEPQMVNGTELNCCLSLMYAEIIFLNKKLESLLEILPEELVEDYPFPINRDGSGNTLEEFEKEARRLCIDPDSTIGQE